MTGLRYGDRGVKSIFLPVSGVYVPSALGHLLTQAIPTRGRLPLSFIHTFLSQLRTTLQRPL